MNWDCNRAPWCCGDLEEWLAGGQDASSPPCADCDALDETWTEAAAAAAPYGELADVNRWFQHLLLEHQAEDH
jgi:hypothetical protein